MKTKIKIIQSEKVHINRNEAFNNQSGNNSTVSL